jgi:hypothetical protein
MRSPERIIYREQYVNQVKELGFMRSIAGLLPNFGIRKTKRDLIDALTLEKAHQYAHIREQINYYLRVGLLEIRDYYSRGDLLEIRLGCICRTKFFNEYVKKLRYNIRYALNNHPDVAFPNYYFDVDKNERRSIFFQEHYKNELKAIKELT